MMTNLELVEKAERLIDGESVDVDGIRIRIAFIPDNVECCEGCQVSDLCSPRGSDIFDLCLCLDGFVDDFFIFELVKAH